MSNLIQTLEGIRDERAHTRNAFLTYTSGSGLLVRERAERELDAINLAICLLHGMQYADAAE